MGEGSKFYVAGGTLALDAESYVKRKADDQLFENLVSGNFCYVLNSRQMGKSSISVRTLSRLTEAGQRTCFIDLTKIGGKNVTPDQWYAGLTGEVGRSLGLRGPMLTYWKENSNLGAMQRFFGSLREIALEQVREPIVIFIDEIDATRSLSFSTDEFFAAIRECHNRRVHDAEFKRLTFCMVGVALPSDLISDPRTTPFNVGERIVLTDFTPSEAAALSKGLGPNGSQLLQRILYWTNGHPFLTQSLCAEAVGTNLKTQAEIDALVHRTFLSAEARDTNINLADIGNRVLNGYEDPDQIEAYRADILALYLKIRKGREKVLDDETNRMVGVLKLSGVLGSENKTLRVRNRIYENVFDADWVRQNMPHAEIIRQKRAFFKGVLRTLVATSLITSALSVTSVWALREKAHALDAQARAEQKRNEAERAKSVAQAERMRAQGLLQDVRRANDIATAQAEKAKSESLRAVMAELVAKNALKNEEQAKNKILSLNERLKQALLEAQKQSKLANISADVAKREANRANSEATRATAESARATEGYEKGRQLLYSTRVSLANRELTEGNAARMQELLLASYDPDPQGSVSFDWSYLWNQLSNTGERHPAFKPRTGSVGFLDEGLVGVDPSGTVLLDRAGKLTSKKIAGSRVLASSWSSKARRGVVTTLDGRAKIFDLNGDEVESFKFAPLTWSVSASEDLKTIVGSSRGLLMVAQKKEKGWVVAPRGGLLSGWTLSPDGRSIALIGTVINNVIKVVSSDTFKDIANIDSKFGSPVTSVKFSYDGKYVALGGTLGEVSIVETRTGEVVYKNERLRNATIRSMAFSKDGLRLAVGTIDGLVQVYSVRTQANFLELAPMQRLFGHSTPVEYMLFDEDGDRLLTSAFENDTRVWNLDLPRLNRTSVSAVTYDRSGRFLVASTNREGVVMDTLLGTTRRLPIPQEQGLLCTTISKDGQKIGTVSVKSSLYGSSYTLTILSQSTLQTLVTQTLTDTPDFRLTATKADFSADGEVFSTCFGPKQSVNNPVLCSLRIFRTNDLKQLFEIKQNQIGGHAFAPSGRRLWYTQGDNLRSVETRRFRMMEPVVIGESVTNLAISANGQAIAVGNPLGRIYLYSIVGNNLVQTDSDPIQSQSTSISSLAFHPDGKTLAVGGFDRTVRLWNLTTRLSTLSFGGYDQVVKGLAFSPDGLCLATGTNPTRSWIRAASRSQIDQDVAALRSKQTPGYKQFEDAQNRSEKSKKPIFMIFVGRDQTTYNEIFEEFAQAPVVRSILERYFEVVLISTTVPNPIEASRNSEIYARYMASRSIRIPSYAFATPNGDRILTSIVEDGPHKGQNVGVPAEDWELDQFAKDLRRASPNITEREVKILIQFLKGI